MSVVSKVGTSPSPRREKTKRRKDEKREKRKDEKREKRKE
jgi:hypothetical protein